MADPAAFAGPQRGRVATFDAARGLGEVENNEGVRVGFHATSIADGSRHIAAGTSVMYIVVPGHRGLYEARSLAGLTGSVESPAPGSHHVPA